MYLEKAACSHLLLLSTGREVIVTCSRLPWLQLSTESSCCPCNLQWGECRAVFPLFGSGEAQSAALQGFLGKRASVPRRDILERHGVAQIPCACQLGNSLHWRECGICIPFGNIWVWCVQKEGCSDLSWGKAGEKQPQRHRVVMPPRSRCSSVIKSLVSHIMDTCLEDECWRVTLGSQRCCSCCPEQPWHRMLSQVTGTTTGNQSQKKVATRACQGKLQRAVWFSAFCFV